jgi:hypothetical protein
MTTMEDLFAPTTRFRDLYHAAREGIDDEDDSDYDEEEAMEALVELELVTGSSAEDTFLHSGFSWRDYYSFGHGKIVWLSPDVFFNSTWIDTSFQTEYRRFLTVYIHANEETKIRNSYTFTPLQKHTQPLRVTFCFSS